MTFVTLILGWGISNWHTRFLRLLEDIYRLLMTFLTLILGWGISNWHTRFLWLLEGKPQSVPGATTSPNWF